MSCLKLNHVRDVTYKIKQRGQHRGIKLLFFTRMISLPKVLTTLPKYSKRMKLIDKLDFESEVLCSKANVINRNVSLLINMTVECGDVT